MTSRIFPGSLGWWQSDGDNKLFFWCYELSSSRARVLCYFLTNCFVIHGADNDYVGEDEVIYE